MRLIGFVLVVMTALFACGDAPSAPTPPKESPAPDPVGTYELDKDAFRESMNALTRAKVPMWDSLPAEAREEGLAAFEEEIASSYFVLTLENDDGFVVSGFMGDEVIDARGTYVIDGNTVTLTTTHEGGELLATPVRETARLSGKVLEVAFDDGTPFALVLRKP